MRYKHGCVCGRSPGMPTDGGAPHEVFKPASGSRPCVSSACFPLPLFLGLWVFPAFALASTCNLLRLSLALLVVITYLFIVILSCTLLIPTMAAPSSQSSAASLRAATPGSDASHNRKSMSWRKPVPKFLPSPPPSPPPPSPAHRFGALAAASASDSDVPPLPADWREAIERALTRDQWQRGGPMVAYGGGMNASVGDVWTRPRSPTPDPRWEPDFTGLSAPSASTLDFRRHLAERDRNIYYHEDRSHKALPRRPETPQPSCSHKHLHRTYRPPTPPLPTHYKKRRLPDDDAVVPVPLMEPYRRVYPETPTLFGHCDTVMLDSLPPSTLDLSCAALPRAHSIAGWDVPVLPIVLSGPPIMKKTKSGRSLTKTVVRGRTMQPSRPSWVDSLCVRRKGANRSQANAQKAKRVELPGLPPVSQHKRLSMASTVVLLERERSPPLQVVLFIWDQVRCWSKNCIKG
ncbi:hypothetical protein OE88DRAFT_1804757 [Heliocybe sulcata]|uniref:Uncharacterized protein n=1 Tax=Heliocybe sulcata TaxID=5364 RepID=A0A5C3NF36_9AGAM|nr:hypothetical protein OE88DRAFT_1804757 [Heliocybe sulcata]